MKVFVKIPRSALIAVFMSLRKILVNWPSIALNKQAEIVKKVTLN